MELKTHVHTKPCTQMLKAVLVLACQNLKATELFFSRRMEKYTVAQRPQDIVQHTKELNASLVRCVETSNV